LNQPGTFTFTSERLELRPPCIDDAPALFRLMSDRELTAFLSWEPHTTIDTTRALIGNLVSAQQSDTGYHWCVCLDSEIIGLASLIDVKRTIRTWTLDRAELSYWIAHAHQGCGYATEACRRIIGFGFEALALHRIIVAHAEENTASKRICEKLEFRQYAHEHDAFKKDGRWHDLLWYEMIRTTND
jgi:[ribosomal protein S5]-alanine N-acetyltransferase